MQALVNGFSWLVDTITLAFNFFISSIKTMIDSIIIIGKVVNLSNIILGTIPSWLLTFGTLTIAISVVFLIFGRETGKSD